MKKLATLAMTGMFAGASLIGATPSSAASNEINYAVKTSGWPPPNDAYCGVPGGAAGCVEADGDILWLRDLVKDGRSIQMQWRDMDGDRYGICYNTKGVDAGWTYCNKNFPEGHKIRWRLKFFSDNGEYIETGYRYTTA